MRIVVLASGRGTNFAAIADATARGDIPQSEVVALIVNRRDAAAQTLARERGIPVEVVESARFKGADGKFDREAFERALSKALESHRPDLVCLAGYMLILGSAFVRQWRGKMLNIHPSLLPEFRGLHPQRQALEAGRTRTGCTVHWVTEELDGGPPLLQREVPILPGDTEATLAARLLPVEHATYVEALRGLAVNHVKSGRQE